MRVSVVPGRRGIHPPPIPPTHRAEVCLPCPIRLMSMLWCLCLSPCCRVARSGMVEWAWSPSCYRCPCSTRVDSLCFNVSHYALPCLILVAHVWHCCHRVGSHLNSLGSREHTLQGRALCSNRHSPCLINSPSLKPSSLIPCACQGSQSTKRPRSRSYHTLVRTSLVIPRSSVFLSPWMAQIGVCPQPLGKSLIDGVSKLALTSLIWCSRRLPWTLAGAVVRQLCPSHSVIVPPACTWPGWPKRSPSQPTTQLAFWWVPYAPMQLPLPWEFIGLPEWMCHRHE